MSATDDLRHSLALLNHQFASLESLNLWTLPSSSTLTNKPTIEETRDENETLARQDLPTIIASHSSKDQLAFTSPTSPLRERSQTSSSSAAGSVSAGTMSPTITALEFGNDMLWDALGLEREDLESEENHKSEERLDNVGKAMSAGSLSPTPTSNDLFNFADFPSFSSVSDISLKSKDTGDEEDQRRSQALLSFPLPPSPVQQSKPVTTADATPVEDAEINEREKEASVTEMPKNETQRSVLGLGITTEPVDMRQNSQKRYVSGSESRSPTRSDSSESIEALAEESKPVIAEPRGRTGRPRLSHRDQLDRIPSFIGSVGTLEPPSPVKANFSSSQRMSSSAPSSPTVRTFGLSTGVSPPKPVVWGANTSRLSLTESGIPALQFGNAAADDYYAQRMSALTQKMEKLKKKKSEPTLRGPRASESPSPGSSPTLSRPPMPTRMSSAPPSTSPRISAPRSPLGGPRSPLSNNFVAATEAEILKDDKPVQQVKRRSSRFSLNNLRFSSKKSPSLKSPPLPVSSSALPPQESQPSTSKAVKKKASLSSLASKASAKISGSSPRAPSFRSHKDSIALKSPVPTIQPVHVGRSTSRGHSPPPSPALSSLPSPAFSESSFRPPMPPLPSPSLRPPAQQSSPKLPGSPVFPTIKQAVEAHSPQQPMQVMTRSNTSCFIEQLDDDVEPFPLRQGSSSKASPIPEPVELREPDTEDGKVESSPDVADAEEEVDSRGPSLSIETEESESSFEAHVMTASKITSPRLAPASLPPVTVSASPPTIDYFSPFDPSMALLDTSTSSGSRPSTPLSPTFGVELVNRPRRGSSIMQSAIMPDSMPMASSPAESASLSHESFERVGSPEVEEVISFPFPDSTLEAPTMSRKNSNADSTSRSELAFSTTDTRDSQSSNGHDDSGWNNDTTDVTSVEESSSSHGHASKQSNESADQQFVEASAGPESETDALEDAPEEKEEADEAVPLAQAIPGAVAVQESLRAEVGSVVSGGGDKSDPFEFSEHLREASSGTSRALTPEPVGHSMLPQTDDAVERKRPLLKSPSQPLDPVIAESTLMISDSPPLARIDLQETSTANRSRSSSASEGSRPKPALRIDVNAMPRSWTASGPSKALLSPASAVTTSSSHSHAPRAPSPTRAPSKAAPQVSAIPASPRFPSPLSSRGHEDSSSQRKIYIVDSQKHFIANMGPKTRCGDVVDLARSKNLLTEGTDAEGGWALWELCRDAGLERPCREYEILTDVLSSWGQEKNTLLIRRTLIWPILSACLRPQPLMTKNEQVHIELKTGKWVKRNMIVEDGVISLSKSGKAKDATVLCKLNTFDAFFVSPGASRRSNAPRPCLFALKSSVARHQYEDESDHCYYVAVKSNDEVTSWIKSIIEARNDFLRRREVEVLGQTSLPKTVSNWQTLLSPVGPPASSSSPSTSPPSMTALSAKSAPASVAAPVSSRMPMPAPPRTTSSPMVAQSTTGARSSSRARSNSQPAPKTSRAPMPPGIGPPPIPLPSLFNRQQQQPSKGVPAARMPLQPQPANVGGARSTTFANATTPSGLDKFAPTAGAAIRMQQMQQQQTLLDRRDVELRLRAHQST